MSDLEIYDSAESGKDYLLQVKIRNAPLRRALRSRGFRTLKQLSVAAGISYQSVIRYFSLTKAPLTKTGNWAPSALALAKALRLPPDSLFPQQHLDTVLAKNSGEMEVSREELMLMVSDRSSQETPEEHLISDQSKAALLESLAGLRAREERVIRMRYGLDDGNEYTLEQISQKFGVGRERIRQLEASALRRMRHPERLRKMANAGVVLAENEMALRARE
jgi:RNA polymerase sigma factor (sigma-70 family)